MKKRIRMILVFFLVYVIAVIILLTWAYYYENNMPEEQALNNKINLKLNWSKDIGTTIGTFSEIGIISYLSSEDKETSISRFSINENEELVFLDREGNINTVNLNNGNIKETLKVTNKEVTNIIFKDNKVYIIYDDEGLCLCIVDLEKNKVIKEIKSNYYFIKPTVLFYNDNLILWGDHGTTFVVDTFNEKIKKRTLPNVGVLKRSVSYAFVNNNILYYSLLGYSVYAMDLDTFTTVWSYDENISHAGDEPFLIGDKIYLSNYEYLLRFNANNGQIEMKSKIPFGGGHLLSDGKDLYVVGSNYISKIDKSTGRDIWHKNADASRVSTEIFEDSIFYIEHTVPTTLMKINKDSGVYEWSNQLNHYKYSVEKVFSAEKYDIYEQNEGSIYVVDKKLGMKLWRFEHTKNRKRQYWKVHKDLLIIYDGKNMIYTYSLEQ